MSFLPSFLPDLHDRYLLKIGSSESREMLYEHLTLLYYGKKHILLLRSKNDDDFYVTGANSDNHEFKDKKIFGSIMIKK